MKNFIPILILVLGALLLGSCATEPHTVKYHEAARTYTCRINSGVSTTGEYPTMSAAEADATIIAQRLRLQVDMMQCEENL